MARQLPNKKTKELKDWEMRPYYEDLAKQIEREDGLVNTRIRWMLVSQGFLFTALALIVKQSPGGNERSYDFLTHLIPFTGVVLSITGFLGVFAANIALRELKKNWENVKEGPFIRPFGNKIASFFGNFPSIVLPLVLGAIWIIILRKSSISYPF